jgi:hypothetical protein
VTNRRSVAFVSPRIALLPSNQSPSMSNRSRAFRFRLLGVGASALTTAEEADPAVFVDGRAAEAEHAVDRVRARFGDGALVRGLAFEGPEKR